MVCIKGVVSDHFCFQLLLMILNNAIGAHTWRTKTALNEDSKLVKTEL